MVALTKYWRKYPPVHVILRAVHCDLRADEETAQPTTAELMELNRLSRSEQSFDSLPVYMQDALRKMRKG